MNKELILELLRMLAEDGADTLGDSAFPEEPEDEMRVRVRARQQKPLEANLTALDQMLLTLVNKREENGTRLARRPERESFIRRDQELSERSDRVQSERDEIAQTLAALLE